MSDYLALVQFMSPIKVYGSNQTLWVQSKIMGPIKVYGSNQRFMGPIKISFIFMNKGCEHESEISF